MEQENIHALSKYTTTTWKPPANLDSLSSEVVKAHLSAPRIAQISVDFLSDELNKVILTIAHKQGIKADAIQVQDVSRFTCKYFKDFTLPELEMAFEYYNARKLSLSETFGHYGILSMDFWGGVLKAFREHRIEETRKEQIKQGTLDQDQTRIPTAEEVQEKNRKAMALGVLEVWKMKKANRIEQYDPLIMGMGHLYYDFVRDNGVMSKPTKEEEQEIKAAAANMLKDEIRLRQLNASRTEFKALAQALNEVRKTPNFKNTCKKIAFREWLADVVLAEVDLQALITEKMTTK